jgi:rubrerythrin
MNIYDFALQLEQDSESFYRDMAAHTSDAGMQKIWNALANDEVKHYMIVKQLKAEAPAPQMEDTAVLATAHSVFSQMAGRAFDAEPLVHNDLAVDAYRQAQELERQSREYYQEKADEVSQESHKALLLRIAQEENKHYFLLDHMIEFVNRPQTWIEDAEFNHLEEY